MRASGFTLLELLVVIAILGILLALASSIPRDPYALRSAATTLSNQVTRARMEALQRNEFVGIRVDKSGGQFFLFEDKDRNLAFSTGDTVIAGTVTKLPSSEYPGVKLGSSVASGGYTFVYDTRGISRSMTAFNVPITNAAATRTKTVVVTAQGRASLQ